jgi:hypothetical protein
VTGVVPLRGNSMGLLRRPALPRLPWNLRHSAPLDARFGYAHFVGCGRGLRRAAQQA